MLCAGEEEAAVDVARQATTRSELSLDTDIVVVDSAGLCAGVLPMRVLMEAVTTIQTNRSLYADPLTGLPSRVVLEQTIGERLESRVPSRLSRIDLTGLELYNRAYGLPHGDSVIRSLASLLQSAPGEQSSDGAAEESETFLAHLGGDDFVMLMPPDKAAAACETVLREFACQPAPVLFAGTGAKRQHDGDGAQRQHAPCSPARLPYRRRHQPFAPLCLPRAHAGRGAKPCFGR